MDISIGFLSTGDAQDPRTWSGTQYFMARALAARVRELHYFGPMPVPMDRMRMRLNKLRGRLGIDLQSPGKTFFDANLNARRLNRHLARRPVDVLFAPAGSALIARYQGDVPVVYSSDTTFRLMRDYYPSFRKLCPKAVAEADAVEAAALAASDLLLMPSPWAARSVIDDYGTPASRVHVMPFGVNMQTVPPRDIALGPRPDGPLRLLFVGVDWERKGGDIFIETLAALRAQGVDVRATIIGCVPPPGTDLAGVDVIRYLDKSKARDAARLAALYQEADFLQVPSRQECFGIVFAEALAYGAVPIAADTGGVSGIIRHGETGFLLDLEARGAAYARTILAASTPRLGGIGARDDLRHAGRDDYENRLTWDAWADRALELVDAHLSARTP